MHLPREGVFVVKARLPTPRRESTTCCGRSPYKALRPIAGQAMWTTPCVSPGVTPYFQIWKLTTPIRNLSKTILPVSVLIEFHECPSGTGRLFLEGGGRK